jgi:hypothetical protein
MRKSHFNDEFLVLLGPIISRLFTCSNAEKNKTKKQRVLALVLSLWVKETRKNGAKTFRMKTFSLMAFSVMKLNFNLYSEFLSLTYHAQFHYAECH